MKNNHELPKISQTTQSNRNFDSIHKSEDKCKTVQTGHLSKYRISQAQLQISDKKDKLKFLHSVYREKNHKILQEYKGKDSLKKNEMYDSQYQKFNYPNHIQEQIKKIKEGQQSLKLNEQQNSQDKLTQIGQNLLEKIQEIDQETQLETKINLILLIKNFSNDTEQFKFNQCNELAKINEKCLETLLTLLQDVAINSQKLHYLFYSQLDNEYENHLLKLENIKRSIIQTEQKNTKNWDTDIQDKIVQLGNVWNNIWTHEKTSNQIDELIKDLESQKKQGKTKTSKTNENTEIEKSYSELKQIIENLEETNKELTERFNHIRNFIESIQKTSSKELIQKGLNKLISNKQEKTHEEFQTYMIEKFKTNHQCITNYDQSLNKIYQDTIKQYFKKLMPMKPNKQIIPIQIKCLDYLSKSFIHYINIAKLQDEEMLEFKNLVNENLQILSDNLLILQQDDAKLQSLGSLIIDRNQNQDQNFYNQNSTMLKNIKLRWEHSITSNIISKKESGLTRQGQSLGSGTYGAVYEIIDFEDMIIYAGKISHTKEQIIQQIIFYRYYIKEKKQYQYLDKILDKKQFENHSLRLQKFSDSSLELFFELGLCSLKDYCQHYQKTKEIISIENVLYIFKTGVIFIYDFMNNALCHGDIKPANMQIIINKLNKQKVIRFIDFGGSCQNLIPHEYTSEYYISPFIGLDENNNPIITDYNTRFIQELYQLIRTLQDICLTKNDAKLFYLKECKLDELILIQNRIESYYFHENLQEKIDQSAVTPNIPSNPVKLSNNPIDKDQNEVVKSEREKRDEFLLPYLKKMFKFIKETFFKKQGEKQGDFQQMIESLNIFVRDIPLNNYFDDPEEICDKIVTDRRKKIQQDTDFLQVFFGLQGYMDLQVKYQLDEDDKQNRQSIIEEAEHFASDTSHRILVIMANAGCGKTLSLLQIQQLYQKKRIDSILLKLSEFTADEESTKQNLQQAIEERLNSIKERCNYIEQYKMIILLDGYDEYNNKMQNFVTEIFQMHIHQFFKIIITTRIEYQTEQEVQSAFSLPEKPDLIPKIVYLKSFDKQQRDQFIMNFIENSKKIQSQFIDVGYTFYETTEQYNTQFMKFDVLENLTKIPVSLQIILVSLKKLVEAKDQQVTEFIIYEEYFKQNAFKELKRKGANYSEELNDNYQIEVNEGDLLKYEYVEQIINDAYSFSQKLAYYLFKEGKLAFFEDEAISLGQKYDLKIPKLMFNILPLVNFFGKKAQTILEYQFQHKTNYEHALISGFFSSINYINQELKFNLEKLNLNKDNIMINMGSFSSEINVMKGISQEIMDNKQEYKEHLTQTIQLLKQNPQFQLAYNNCNLILIMTQYYEAMKQLSEYDEKQVQSIKLINQWINILNIKFDVESDKIESILNEFYVQAESQWQIMEYPEIKKVYYLMRQEIGEIWILNIEQQIKKIDFNMTQIQKAQICNNIFQRYNYLNSFVGIDQLKISKLENQLRKLIDSIESNKKYQNKDKIKQIFIKKLNDELYYDLYTKKLLKCRIDLDNQQIDNLKQIQSIFDKLPQIGLLINNQLNIQNDQKNIFFDSHQCNLFDYVQEKNLRKEKIQIHNLMYLTKTLLSFFMEINQSGIYFPSLNLQNIVLFTNKSNSNKAQNQLSAKIDNLHLISQSLQNFKFSKFHFCNSRIKYQNDIPIIQNKNEMFMSQIYSVLRIFQEIILDSKTFESKTVPTIDELQELQKQIEILYADEIEQNEVCKQFFQFLNDKIIQNQYSEAELLQFVRNIEYEFFEDTACISDKIFKQYIQRQQIQWQKKFEILSMRITNAIDQRQVDGSNLSKLSAQMLEFLYNDQNRFFIIQGQRNVGKSFYFQQIQKQLLEMSYTFVLIQNQPQLYKKDDSLQINNESLINQLKSLLNNIKEYNLGPEQTIIILIDHIIQDDLDDKEITDLILDVKNYRQVKFIFSSTSNEIQPEYLKDKLRIKNLNNLQSSNLNQSSRKSEFMIEPLLLELTVSNNLKSKIELYIQQNTNSIEYLLLQIPDFYDQYRELSVKLHNDDDIYANFDHYEFIYNQITQKSNKNQDQITLINAINNIQQQRIYKYQIKDKNIQTQILDNINQLQQNLAIILFEKPDYVFSEKDIKNCCQNMLISSLPSHHIINFILLNSNKDDEENTCYKFTLKYVEEYLISQGLIRELKSLSSEDKNKDYQVEDIVKDIKDQKLKLYINENLITDYQYISQNILETFNQQFDKNQKYLFMSSAMKIIESSKYLESALIAKACGNCFTILNILGFNFSRLNFSNCKLSGANLENLDLSYCNFDNCWFQNVNFRYTDQELTSFENTYSQLKIQKLKQSNKPFQTMHHTIKQLLMTSDDSLIIYNYQNSYDIIVYDANKQYVVIELKSHTSSITMMCITCDDRFLCSSDNYKLILWDLHTKAAISQISINSTCLSGSFFYDMTKLVIGSSDKKVYVYQCDKQKLIEFYQLTKHTAQVFAVCCSKKDGIFATAADDYYITIWNRDSKDLFHIKCSQLINCLVFSSDGLWLFSGHENSEKIIWNVKDGTQKYSNSKINGSIWDCYFINNNKNVIFRQNKEICIKKLSNLEDNFTISQNIEKFIMTQDDKKGLVSLKTGGLQYIDIQKTQKKKLKVSLSAKNNHLFYGKISFSGDSKLLAIHDHQNLVILDFENGLNLIQEIIDQSFACVSLSYTGKLYAYFDQISKCIKIKEINSILNPILIVTSIQISYLCFSNDQNMLVSGGKGKKIKIWNPKDGNLLKTLESDEMGEINALSITDDSKKIIAIGTQNKLHIWKGFELQFILDNYINVEKIFISQKENYITFKYYDLTYKTYHLSIEEKKISLYSDNNDNQIQIISYDENFLLSSNKGGMSQLEGLKNSKYEKKIQQIENLSKELIQFSPDNKYLITGDCDTGFQFYNVEQEFNKQNKQQKKEISIYEKISSGIDFMLKDKFMGYTGSYKISCIKGLFKLSEFRHPTIKIEGQFLAKSTGGSSCYRFAILDPCLNGFSGKENRNRKFAFKILVKNRDWIGCGICHKQTLINKQYSFDYSSLGHGAYMITNNGGIWSNHLSEQNNKIKAFPFEYGDTVICEYKPSQLKLQFSKMDEQNKLYSDIYALDLQFQPDRLYHPCMIFYYDNCAIEFKNF